MAASSLHIDNQPECASRFSFFRQAGFALSMVTLASASSSAAAQTGLLAAQPGQVQRVMQTTSASGVPAREAGLQNAGTASSDAAFNRADRDRDGRLSRQEVEHFPALALSFEQIDRNHDSFISREEFNSAVAN